MRCLDRQKRWILISRFETLEPVVDEQGRLTGQHVAARSRQVPVLASVSAVKGNAENQMFGQALDYDRTVTIDDPVFDIDESAVCWIDKNIRGLLVNGGYFEKYEVLESGEDIDAGEFDDEDGDAADGGGFEYPVWTNEPHDYVIKQVARSDSYTLLAVKRVEVSK